MTPLIYTNCHRIMGGIYAGWRSEFGKVTAKFRTTGLPRKRPTQRDLKFKSDKRNSTIGDHVEAVPDMTTYDLLSFTVDFLIMHSLGTGSSLMQYEIFAT